MAEQHLITPPPELVKQLRSEAPYGIRDAGVTRELHLIHAAYRAGVNAALRPKPPNPPSLADQGLIELSNLVDDLRRPEAAEGAGGKG